MSGDDIDPLEVEETSSSRRVCKIREVPELVKDCVSALTSKDLRKLVKTYPCFARFNPSLPDVDERSHPPPPGKVTLYKSFLTLSNLRIPFTSFFIKILNHYKIGVGQLHPFASGKIVVFEMLLRALGQPLSVYMFREMFLLLKKGDWFTFGLRDKNIKIIETPNKVPMWRFDYFFVDDTFIPEDSRVVLRLGREVNDKAMNKAVNAKVPKKMLNTGCYAKLCSLSTIPHRSSYPEGMLAMAGISPDWDWTRIPILRKKSSGEYLTLMEALDFDLADLDVLPVRANKALALRKQVGEVASLRPDAWGDGYECGTLLDDTQPSLPYDTQPGGVSGLDIVEFTHAN